MSVELPDLLKSLHLCSLNENEVFFLKDIPKPLAASNILKQKVRDIILFARYINV